MNISRSRALLVCVLVLTFLLPVIACEKAKQMTVAGTYVSEKDPKHTRELKSDGTVVEMEGSTGGEGTYEVSGDEITFKFQVLGTARIMKSKLEGKAIIDGDGERFVKQ
jgi:hypothetical protein